MAGRSGIHPRLPCPSQNNRGLQPLRKQTEGAVAGCARSLAFGDWDRTTPSPRSRRMTPAPGESLETISSSANREPIREPNRRPNRELGSNDLPAAGRAWSTEVQCGMLRARISHLRRTATFAHALVCFHPRRNLSPRLRPVGYGCLITPIHKMRHRGLVRPRHHKLPHTLLAVPDCDRPEGPSSIGQERARLKSARAFYLPQRTPRVKRKERKKSNRADSEPCQTNKCHSLRPLNNP